MKANKIKQAMFVLSIIFMFMGCGTVQPSNMFPSVKNLTGYKEAEIEVLFYRLGGDEETVAVPKIGERVVGSVLPYSFAKTKVCMDSITAGVAGRGKLVTTTNYIAPIEVRSSEAMYFRINELGGGNFTVQRVDSQTAQKDIKEIEQKSKILNRNKPYCKVPVEIKGE